MTVLERVPVDDIAARAREVQVGRVLLTLVLGALYGLGWVARKAVLALAVAGTSIKLGWQDAGRPPGVIRGPA